VARTRVEDAETAIKRVHDDMRNAGKAGFTTTKPETTFEGMLNSIGDTLSDLASSDDEKDGEDEDDEEEDTAGGKLSEDEEPGWVIGTISETVQTCMEHFWQKQMKVDELTRSGSGDPADYFSERGEKNGMICGKVPAVMQPRPANDAGSSAPTTFSEPMETDDSGTGKLQMPQVTSRPGSSHKRLGSRKLQTLEPIQSFHPAPMHHSSPIQISKHVEPVSFNPCTSRP